MHKGTCINPIRANFKGWNYLSEETLLTNSWAIIILKPIQTHYKAGWRYLPDRLAYFSVVRMLPARCSLADPVISALLLPAT